ncbi:MAG: hypothetical protein K8J08_11490 [Thermoanaerobaculia bacterium]|nr:hypothetical protein [Thermoanaerobaculia bacterium]
MTVRRLPRIDLAKLISQDPAERRPTVDALGESLCGHGAVRVLVEESLDPRALERAGSKVLAGLDQYFGLPPGRLGDSVTGDSSAADGDERDCVMRIGTWAPRDDRVAPRTYVIATGHAQGLETRPRDLASSSVSWTPRVGEILILAGPRLAAWTGGVVAVGSATPLADSLAAGILEPGAAVIEPGATLWAQGGAADPLSEFLPGRSR